jgi:hypothetical protein
VSNPAKAGRGVQNQREQAITITARITVRAGIRITTGITRIRMTVRITIGIITIVI